MWIFCRGTLHKNSFGGVWCGCHIHVFTFSCVMWTINLQISQISQSKLVEGYKTSIWENHHNTCIAFWKKFKNVAKLTSISRIWMPAIKTWQLLPPPPPHTHTPKCHWHVCLYLFNRCVRFSKFCGFWWNMSQLLCVLYTPNAKMAAGLIFFCLN